MATGLWVCVLCHLQLQCSLGCVLVVMAALSSGGLLAAHALLPGPPSPCVPGADPPVTDTSCIRRDPLSNGRGQSFSSRATVLNQKQTNRVHTGLVPQEAGFHLQCSVARGLHTRVNPFPATSAERWSLDYRSG